jgi:hypothetical protein
MPYWLIYFKTDLLGHKMTLLWLLRWSCAIFHNSDHSQLWTVTLPMMISKIPIFIVGSFYSSPPLDMVKTPKPSSLAHHWLGSGLIHHTKTSATGYPICTLSSNMSKWIQQLESVLLRDKALEWKLPGLKSWLCLYLIKCLTLKKMSNVWLLHSFVPWKDCYEN